MSDCLAPHRGGGQAQRGGGQAGRHREVVGRQAQRGGGQAGTKGWKADGACGRLWVMGVQCIHLLPSKPIVPWVGGA